jgi:riboflavin transporter FmnP
MNLIKDIREELNSANESDKAIRKFALIILLLLGYFIFQSVHLGLSKTAAFLGGASLVLILGMIFPHLLQNAYRTWLVIGFLLGWFVSRIILFCLFYFVLTPFGFLARVFNKKFLDTDFREQKQSYWIPKPQAETRDFTKLF